MPSIMTVVVHLVHLKKKIACQTVNVNMGLDILGKGPIFNIVISDLDKEGGTGMVATESIRRDAGTNGYLVRSSDGESWYAVSLGLSPRCTCKGWTYRATCRHVTAVQAMYAETEVTMEDSDEPDEDEPGDERLTWDSGEGDESEVTMVNLTGMQDEAASRDVESTTASLLANHGTYGLEHSPGRRTMSSVPDVDYAAEMADRRFEHLKACVREDDVWTTFKSYLDLIANVKSNALAKLVDEFMELPPQDAYELQGIVQGMPLRQKIRLADTVLECLGQAWLSVAHDVENRPF
jgi:hypothetical protein